MAVVAIALQSLLALVFLMAGGTKLLGIQMQVENFKRYGYPQWFRLVTGAVEVTGAVGMVVGVWVGQVAIAAGFWLGITMIGAVYTDLFRRGSAPPSGAAAPAVLLALAVAVAVLRIIEVVDWEMPLDAR